MTGATALPTWGVPSPARTLLRYGFEHLDLYRVTAVVAAHNAAAQRGLEKCGFVQEGRERQAIFCGGRRWDRVRYGLLRTEFEEGCFDRSCPRGG